VVDPANFGDGAKRMLIVGLGDENQGDCGIGSYLVRCLGQYTWPEGVDFCHLREISWERINDYSKIILLDAMHGPERPGSVYQADGEALMACSANHHRHSIEPFLA
jgi:hydrogenase maturation protease